MKTPQVKILFLASNPVQTPLLRLDEEIHSINEKIRASEYRDWLELKSFWAVRPDDLLQLLNEQKPIIVHFSGHGSDVGEIILMDNYHQPKPVNPAALKMLFTSLKHNIRVVVLNACFSKLQAMAIAEVVDCVIGMNTKIGDKAAIVFAASFYRAIGFGCSIQEAFEQGKTALLLENISEESTPELLTQSSVYPASIVLVKPEASTIEIGPLNTQPSTKPQELLPKLVRSFSLDELKAIIFILGVDPDSIGGTTRDSMAREMIGFFNRRSQLDSLISECRKQRPNITW